MEPERERDENMAELSEANTTELLEKRDFNDNKDDSSEVLNLENNNDDQETSEERILVDRRKLELLLQGGKSSTLGIKEENISASSGEEFFQNIEAATRTTISWPSRLKIGAKSKKDPHIKVTGLPDNIRKARQMILSVLDSKACRVTLKMDVSFTDHSHIIGRGGNCIKRVMQDTGCHIHFPDSNRTSSDKSNQVSIAGPPLGVEAARKQIRELLPIVLMFEIPQNTVVVPDSTSPAIHNIAQKHNVTITFKQRPRAFGFIGTVRGLHSDPLLVRDAVLRVMEHLTGAMPVTVLVTTQMEIDCKHHAFIVGRNGSNIKQIMQSTGASVQFPDQNSQGKRSTVYITGTVESTITAKVQLMDFLPLVLMFDVKEENDGLVSDQRIISQLVDELDVLINVKPKPRQGSRSVIVKSIEKNAQNIYLSRCHLIKEDPKLMPLVTPLLHAVSPMPLRPSHYFNPGNQRMPGMPMPGSEFPTALLNPAGGMNGKFIPTSLNACISDKINTTSPSCSPLHSSSTSPIPQRHSTSPSQRQVKNVIGSYGIRRPTHSPPVQEFQSNKPMPSAVDAIKSSNDLVRTLSVDSLFNSGVTVAKDAGIRGSNSTGHLTIVDSSKTISPLGSDTIPRSAAQENDYSAVQGCTESSFHDSLMSRRFSNEGKDKVQLPGAIGTRFGPSNGTQEPPSQSLPLNGSWNTPKQSIAMLEGVRNSPFGSADTVSPESNLSDSQNELNMSASLSQTSNLIDRLPFRKKNYNIADYELKRQMASNAIKNETDFEEIRMPTGTWSGFGFSKSMPESALKELWVKNNRSQMNKYPLVDSFQPTMENAALLLNNNIDFNTVFSNDSSLGTLAAVTDLCELFGRLGLHRYAEVFQEQEVDLNTFMTLSDDDLKELGVSTFGARRRMVLAIQDLKKIHGQRDVSIPSPQSKQQSQSIIPPVSVMNQQRCMPLDLASSSLRW
eukprot:gene16909-18615_t